MKANSNFGSPSTCLHVTPAFCAVWLVTLAAAVVLFITRPVGMLPDTASYVDAFDVLANGHVDFSRTPVYPLVIGLCRYLFGWFGALKGVVAVQFVTFVISVWYFYRTLGYFVEKEALKILATLLFVFPFITWNNYIMSEALAVSGSVFLIYFTCAVYRRFTLWRASMLVFWLLFLVFLRPSFVYLLPVYAAWGVGVWFLAGRRPTGLAALGAAILAAGALLCYMKAFESRYGVFAVTRVSLTNDLIGAKYFNSLNKDVIDDTEAAREYLSDNIEFNGWIYSWHKNRNTFVQALIGKYGLPECTSMLERSHKASVSLPIKRIFISFSNSQKAVVSVSPYPGLKPFINSFGLSLNAVYWWMLAMAGLIICYTVVGRAVPWLTVMVWLFIAGNICVIVLGSPSGWGRLILPVLPLIIISAAQWFEYSLRGALPALLRDKIFSTQK